MRNAVASALVVMSLMPLTGGAVEPLMGSVVTAASNPGDQFVPAVAWDHDHKRWLLVWEQDVSGVRQIVGRLIANNGSPLGDSFFLTEASSDQTDPHVVYDPGHDRYVVVWVSEYSAVDTDIAGRFIPWDGIDPGLVTFGIEGATSAQLAPAIAYAPAVDELLVVWQTGDGVSPSRIEGKRWATDGTGQVTTTFPIASDATFARTDPRVAWDTDTGRYLVVYERSEGGGQTDVHASHLSFSGSVLTSDLGIETGAGGVDDVDVAACGGAYMVVYTANPASSAQVVARPVAGDLTLGTAANLSAPYTGDSRPAVACNPQGIRFLVAWQAPFASPPDDFTGIVAALVDEDGTIRESFNVQAAVTAGHLSYTTPAVSVGDHHGRAYVVWETDREDLVHQDLAGRWLGVSLFSDDFESGGLSRWSATGP